MSRAGSDLCRTADDLKLVLCGRSSYFLECGVFAALRTGCCCGITDRVPDSESCTMALSFKLDLPFVADAEQFHFANSLPVATDDLHPTARIYHICFCLHHS